MKATAQKFERNIVVLAVAVDNIIEMTETIKEVKISATKSVAIAIDTNVTNTNHSTLGRITTRQMSPKDGE